MILVGEQFSFAVGPELAPLFKFNEDSAYLLRYLSFFVISGMAFLMAVAAAATTKRIVIPVFYEELRITNGHVRLRFSAYFLFVLLW
jgi:hypothetical protein